MLTDLGHGTARDGWWDARNYMPVYCCWGWQQRVQYCSTAEPLQISAAARLNTLLAWLTALSGGGHPASTDPFLAVREGRQEVTTN